MDSVVLERTPDQFWRHRARLLVLSSAQAVSVSCYVVPVFIVLVTGLLRGC